MGCAYQGGGVMAPAIDGRASEIHHCVTWEDTGGWVAEARTSIRLRIPQRHAGEHPPGGGDRRVGALVGSGAAHRLLSVGVNLVSLGNLASSREGKTRGLALQ